MDDDAARLSGSGPDSSGPIGETAAWTVLAYLITGPFLYGGLGLLLDRWLGTDPVFVLIGGLGGMGLALYVVWVRYGTHDRRSPPASDDAGHDVP
jgi:F0F1-type ATP synthase assembly protein I